MEAGQEAGRRGPRREVRCGDGVAWLAAARLPADHALVTSLPDASELPELGFEGWRGWFVETAALACRAVAPEAVAVFYQTDVKRDGRWVDKGHLAQLGATRQTTCARAAPPTPTCSASPASCGCRRAAPPPTCWPGSAR